MLHTSPTDVAATARPLSAGRVLMDQIYREADGAFARLPLSELRVLFEAHQAAASALSGVYNMPRSKGQRALDRVDAEIERHEGAMQEIADLARLARPVEHDARVARAMILMNFEGTLFDEAFLVEAETYLADVEKRVADNIARSRPLADAE